MLRRSHITCSYQRGGWSAGSKHQKHVSLNPTDFLYRFPGPRGPGPYTMKYWWTLGCFPTGLSTPFRLNEFLQTYHKEHIPVEVEEWLSCFLHDPLTALRESTEELQCLILEHPLSEPISVYSAPHTMIKQLTKPLQAIERQLGVKIPVSGVRAAINSHTLRETLINDIVEYNECLGVHGSTPHRRLARNTFDDPLLEAPIEKEVSTQQRPPSEDVSSALGIFVSPPNTTAPDERKLIKLLTTFAEGCATTQDYRGAYSLLSDSLAFAHDEEIQSHIHANVCISAIHEGRFQEAVYHGREAALLVSAKNEKLASRGYRLWATAVAYEDDFEQATSIASDALALFPGNVELQKLRDAVSKMKEETPKSRSVGKRYHVQAELRRGIEKGSGRTFDNEFDWVQFKNRLYPSKMDPSTNEMGSVFRRVGDLGGAISTSRSVETL